jgi:hypothetical protein
MNPDYELLFRELQLPTALVDCAAGRITLPIAGKMSPAEWFVFPPALCPVWSNGSLPSYLGYWKHWFGPRPETFVDFDVESGKAREVARTADQFFSHVIMSAICVHDRVTAAIERFASAVGIKNLSEINAVSLKSGDDPHGYTAISQFRKDAPLATVTEIRDYTGEFPTNQFSGKNKWWENSCAFEIPDDALESWPEAIPRPLWLSPGNRKEVFESFLNAGEHFKAWLTLNSPGWSIPDAKKAITALSSAAGDSRFALLAEAWVSVAEDTSGGY